MDNTKLILGVTAIICAAIVELAALAMGYDSAGLAAFMALLGAIAGVGTALGAAKSMINKKAVQIALEMNDDYEREQEAKHGIQRDNDQ